MRPHVGTVIPQTCRFVWGPVLLARACTAQHARTEAGPSGPHSFRLCSPVLPAQMLLCQAESVLACRASPCAAGAVSPLVQRALTFDVTPPLLGGRTAPPPGYVPPPPSLLPQWQQQHGGQWQAPAKRPRLSSEAGDLLAAAGHQLLVGQQQQGQRQQRQQPQEQQQQVQQAAYLDAGFWELPAALLPAPAPGPTDGAAAAGADVPTEPLSSGGAAGHVAAVADDASSQPRDT